MKLWIEQVNRVGLFQIINDAYLFFWAMETASRRILSVEHITSNPTIKIQEEMSKAIINSPAVTAHWNCLLGKVEALDSEESDELLGESVNKWVKISGHSFTSGLKYCVWTGVWLGSHLRRPFVAAGWKRSSVGLVWISYSKGSLLQVFQGGIEPFPQKTSLQKKTKL